VLRNKLYYSVKPLLPPGMRWAVRSWIARKQRERFRESWPILPGSERPPRDWPGWPGGRKFALVLTHDVEGQAGLDKCRRVMELETQCGFRSSFNFIPEGGYRVPKGLRDELTGSGFEVGVHDLHHDGKLYRSRPEFAKKATRINQYLKEWNAVGFRSGFMLHNLEWLQDLNLEYDLSTFDTDPFEPQPDSRNTVFPFWVSKINGGGYVELPYTLAQDSTLFMLLKERTIELWTRKLDWIAEHGGMALLNVHPDYIQFPDESPRRRTYPAEHYKKFLERTRRMYGESFWQALPRELAGFAAPLRPAPPRKPKRIGMVTYSYYFADGRVTRYAEALAGRGDHVDILSLRRSGDKLPDSAYPTIQVLPLQSRENKNERSALSYLFPTVRFLFVSMFWMARRQARRSYDLLHIHNMPDFLVFAAAAPKLAGAKVILDIHDIVPELYGSKFRAPERSVVMRLLKWSERVSALFADHVIISNHLWLDRYAARTGADGKCSVFINNVDRDVFRPRPRSRRDGKFVIIFPGGLQSHQGVDIALRAFQKVLPRAPGAEFHIYGDGNMKQELKDLSAALGLAGSARFFDPVPVRDIAKIMGEADLGVVPKRADSFGNEAYSTKIMEFMSLGVPVIVSDTKIDRYYFNDSVVRFFKSGDADALAEAMLEMIGNPELRREMAARASAYADENSWERRKLDYLNLVDSL
jgi:glycosyltransferase involved in cell wall biosynthesis